ncbi:30S ribosomal protein S5 [archaeon]|nr:30S ribosomal protein S5 [archaeon]
MSSDTLQGWIPQTHLGRLVAEGRITSLDEIFAQGYQIKEPEIVDALLPNLKQEVVHVQPVQRQTDAGEKTSFVVVAVVGNEDGYVGVGAGKARYVRSAVLKAIRDAKLNIIPVRRGCGSWKCACDQPHSVPFRVTGKCGSVQITLIPAPRGLGLVCADAAKPVLRLAGIKDVWSRTKGETRTTRSLIYATFDALRKTYQILTPFDW